MFVLLRLLVSLTLFFGGFGVTAAGLESVAEEPTLGGHASTILGLTMVCASFSLLETKESASVE